MDSVTESSESTESTDSPSFEQLHLSPETLAGLAEKGYTAPTQVQAEAVPKAMAGLDLVVQSRTGTGKTAAFGIPIVEKVDPQGPIQAVVLAPTRELALQVKVELAWLGKPRGLKVECIYGGDSMDRQLDSLRSGVQIVVGTPGRVLDHLRRENLRFDAVKLLVLDEADRMLDMGFAVEMGQIMEYVPEKRQTLLFSATIPLGIRGLIDTYLTKPEWLMLSEDGMYVREVEHMYCLTPRMHKEATLHKIIEYEAPFSSMVFCNTREETRRVATYLAGKGLPVAMLSSDLVQKKRERVMARFRAGEVRHLVTTDVAARGIDFIDLSHVFIFSASDSPEQYIHRAGRTGRVGKSGRAISLLGAHDLANFNRLVKRYHVEVKEMTAPSDAEVRERELERELSQLAAQAAAMPLEAYVEFGALAQRIGAHPERDRIVGRLLQRFFEPPPVEDLEGGGPDLGDGAPAQLGGPRAPGRGEGGGGGRRRPRRPRRP
jgi:ATP-dependent RNA helicase DeaD